MDRRTFLGLGGAAVVGLALPRISRAARPDLPARIPVVRMWSDPTGARVGFDPVGLAVEPGTPVRWVLESGVHSTTAYHAEPHGRPTRIPSGAAAWDSGILVRADAGFEATLEVPGVYDYYCLPHEAAGMVGRIVVGRPGEDFETPDWGRADAPAEAGIPAAARAGFPPVDRILGERRIPHPDLPTPRKETSR